ncbi:30498_t:CDS:2, partial [Gigaspora margarita]
MNKSQQELPIFLNGKNVIKTAQNFLSISAISIASEQAFSCTGRIINDNHTLLNPDT